MSPGQGPGKRPHPPPVWAQESRRAPTAAFPANAPCAPVSEASLWSVPGGHKVPAPHSPVVCLPAPTSVRNLEPQPGSQSPGRALPTCLTPASCLPSPLLSRVKVNSEHPRGAAGAQHPSWRNARGGPECCRAGRAQGRGKTRVHDFPMSHWCSQMTAQRPGRQSPSPPATRPQTSLPTALPGGGGRASAPAQPLTPDGVLTRTGFKPHRSAGMPVARLCPTVLAAEPSLSLWGPVEAGRSGRTSEGWARPECPAPDPPPARRSSRQWWARWEPRADTWLVIPCCPDGWPGGGGNQPFPPHTPRMPPGAGAPLTVQVADLAVLDCWKVTSKWWGPG